MTSNYRVPYSDPPGYAPRPDRPGMVRLDEPLSSGYLQTIGIYSLDEVAIAQYQLAGEASTTKGQYLTFMVATGNAAEGISYQNATVVDVQGTGSSSVQFVDRPDGSFAAAPAPSVDKPTAAPGNSQSGTDASKPSSSETDTSGTTTTTTNVNEATQETVNTTDYTPTDAGGTYTTQPVDQAPQPGDYSSQGD